MQIQNGKIYLSRGEECTFRAKIYMNDGTPFRLLKQGGESENDTFYFTVKRNPYKRDDGEDDYVLRYKLVVYDSDPMAGTSNLPLLDSMLCIQLEYQPTYDLTTGAYEPSVSDKERIANTNCLYKFTGSDDVTTYYVRKNDTELEVYVSDVCFVIPTDDTKNLTEDTYYYALDWVSTTVDLENNTYVKKIPLITPSEFIIGGSIYD